MMIRSKTPLRISFGGGGTDVSPYLEERGGVVLGVTIDKYTYSTLVQRGDDVINVQSMDYDIFTSYSANEEFHYDGNLDLVKATLKVMDIRRGMDIFLHSDIPPGSGLGSSSAIVVALVGLIGHWVRLPLTDYDIAELAYTIERGEMGISGGKQDQYSATFGGFNFVEFFEDKTVVNPLRVERNILNELQYRLMLCFTGRRRLSARIIDDQVEAYRQKKEQVVRALDETKELAIKMKNALLLGKIDEFGSLLHEAWLSKKQFSTMITDSHIDELYEIARKTGAIGGKLLGAGGGGYLLFLSQFDKWHSVAKELNRAGGKVIDFHFDFEGLQTWEVK